MKIGAYGEVMIRLTPPDHYLLEQTHTLRMDFTGTGVNLLANLSHFGLGSTLLTKLPDNRLGDAAITELRKFGIDSTFAQQAHHHIGSYFAETGIGSRPTYVTYQNRHKSSFGLSGPETYPIDEFLADIDLLHICGISLSLTEETWQTARELIQRAYQLNKMICFDFNFRPSLNEEPGKKEVMKQRYEEILPYCSIVFGSSRDVVELLHFRPDILSEDKRIFTLIKAYDLTWFAGTERTYVDNKQYISGFLYTADKKVQTEQKLLHVVDRIGTGDAYAAGILLGFCEHWTQNDVVEYAITNAVVAHTIHGDVPLTTRKQIEQIMKTPRIDLVR